MKLNIESSEFDSKLDWDKISNLLSMMIDFPSKEDVMFDLDLQLSMWYKWMDINNSSALEINSLKSLKRNLIIYKKNIIAYINNLTISDNKVWENISNDELLKKVIEIINFKLWVNIFQEVKDIYSNEIDDQKNRISENILSCLSVEKQKKLWFIQEGDELIDEDRNIWILNNLLNDWDLGSKSFKTIVSFLATTSSNFDINKFFNVLTGIRKKSVLKNFIELLNDNNDLNIESFISSLKTSNIINIVENNKIKSIEKILKKENINSNKIFTLFNNLNNSIINYLIENELFDNILDTTDIHTIINISNCIDYSQFIYLFSRTNEFKNIFLNYNKEDIINNIEYILKNNKMPLLKRLKKNK